MRIIESIRKQGKTVYVNFDNGTFGTRTFENGKWSNSGLSAEELVKAKHLAVRDGKWLDYRAPRNQAPVAARRTVQLDEEDAANQSTRDFHQPATFASMTDAES